MRIHANTLTRRDIYHAADIARVDVVKLDDHGSRKRDHAFDVKLEGESRRRPNGGSSGAGSGYAATWDQWGVFLAILFDLDESMVTPYDESRAHFILRTDARFVRIGGGWDTYWPADAHGDHTFRYRGVSRQQSCTKCSAVQKW